MIDQTKKLLIKNRTRLYLYLSKFTTQKQYWNIVGKISPLDAILDNYFKEKDLFKTGKEVVNFFEKQKLINKKSLTLHIGCGIGRIERHLSPKVQQCYGVDISKTMIKQANLLKKSPNISFLSTDGKNLPFENNKFDFIYSVLVFQHMPKLMFEKNLKEVRRVLKKNGKFFFQIPRDDDEVKEKPAETNPWLMRYYKRSEIEKILKKTGLKINKTFTGFEKDKDLNLDTNFSLLVTKV